MMARRELAVFLVEDKDERINRFKEDIASRWVDAETTDAGPLVLAELSLTPLREHLLDTQLSQRELLLFLDLNLEDTLYNYDPGDPEKKENLQHIKEGFGLLEQDPLLQDHKKLLAKYRGLNLHGLAVLPWVRKSPWAERVAIHFCSFGASEFEEEWEFISSLEAYLASSGKRIELLVEDGVPFFEAARRQSRERYWRRSLDSLKKLSGGVPDALARMIEGPSKHHTMSWSHETIGKNEELYVSTVAKWLRWGEARPSSRLLDDIKVLFMLPADGLSLFDADGSEAESVARRCWKDPAEYWMQQETLVRVLSRLSLKRIKLAGKLDRLRMPVQPALPFLTGLASMLNAVTKDKRTAPESVAWTVTKAGNLGYESRIQVTLRVLQDSETTLPGRLFERILSEKRTALRGTSRAVFGGAFCRSIEESEVESGRGWQHLFTGATIPSPPVAIRFSETGFSFIWFHS